MNFSIARTIRNALAPEHRLSCNWFLWQRLVRSLRERGLSESRESGAFLIGLQDGHRAQILDFVLYDDVDPNCLRSGIVMFDGRCFPKLWSICKQRGLSVVADVHVHPDSAHQSNLDQANPMISCAGHLSIILPRFARRPLQRADMGIYRYIGAKRWESVDTACRAAFFHIGV
jgi:proteasome lid subunit RPN8/RPN11